MFKQLNKNQILAIQIIFWAVYYFLFSIIWAVDGNYKDSFFLEFILLPVRILAVYLTINYLIPQFLLKKKFIVFIISYLSSILIFGLIQQCFIYFFYYSENITTINLFNTNTIVRAIILINSTVFFVSSIYILNLYFSEKEKVKNLLIAVSDTELTLEVKSNRKNHIISFNSIIYIEAMGNYVNYHLDNGKKITEYQSLKKCLENLSNDFLRVHKSYIVNSKKIQSYDKDFIDVSNDKQIPVGASFDIKAIKMK